MNPENWKKHPQLGDKSQELCDKDSAGQLLTSIIDFLPDATLAIDKQGRVIIWNRAMEKLTGAKSEDMLGQGDYKYALPFYGMRRPILANLVLSGQIKLEEEYEGLRWDHGTLEGEVFIPSFGPNGSYIWVKAAPLYDSEGAVVGAIESIRDISDRKRMEEKICSMGRQLSEVIDFLPDATFAINKEGRVITWNRAMERLTGASAQEMIGKGDYEYAIPFYGSRRPILADLVLMPEEFATGKYDHIERDGNTATVEIFIPSFGPEGSFLWAKASPLYDSSGNVAGAIESIRDITQRKRSEEALRRSEQEKAAILGGLKKVAVEYIDPDMRLIWVNSAVQKSLGLSEEQIRGEHCYELIQGRNEPCPGCTAYRALKTGESEEGELVTPDGKTWISRSHPLRGSGDRVSGVVHVAVNISERKQAEQKLANIIDFLPDATFVIGLNREVLAWNRALEELTGIRAEEMIGKADYQYAIPFYGTRRPMLIDLALMPEEQVAAKYPNLRRERNTLITEVYIPTFGSGGAHLWAKASPLFDSMNQLLGAIESVRDMTELRKAEETVERSRAELRIASDIQRSFLPERIPDLAGFDLAATSIPAMEVGGDFYDFIPGEDRLGMVIADVSGKSIPAALFMALSRTIVRANATHHQSGTEVLVDANDMISADSRSGMFVTLFYGILDQSTRNLVYANAGHPPPLLLLSDGQRFFELEVTGIALGIMGGVDYQERQVTISPGDVMIMYTDGVTEALNHQIEQYGLERLRSTVLRARHLSAQGILDEILQDIARFCGGQAQFDDITMIIAKGV